MFAIIMMFWYHDNNVCLNWIKCSMNQVIPFLSIFSVMYTLLCVVLL